MAIKITKLKLNRAKQKIIVSAETESSEEYMTALYLDTQNTFVCKNEPSGSATKIILNPDNLTESTDILTITDGKVTKITDFEIDLTKITAGAISTLSLNKDMVFLFIDNFTLDMISYTVGIVFDQRGFFNAIFRQMHKDIVTTGCCDIPQSAADLALMFEAFQLALLVTDFKKAVYYWRELHIGNHKSLTTKCNCRQ